MGQFPRQAAIRVGVAVVAVLLTAAGSGSASAFPFSKGAPAAEQIGDEQLDGIQRALDERRLIDAGRMIDGAMLSGKSHPRLDLLTGELGLARGRYDAAIQAFRLARRNPAVRSAALQGEALALARSGRDAEATPLLKQVVAEDQLAWRAWNALGAQHDRRQQWSEAELAYEQALAAAPNPAAPLNNRGYSRLLQGRLDAAIGDFVAALRERPDFAEARGNLRLALALRGDYERAVDGASAQERASLLNNAGLAAGARGDFSQAEAMLQKAIDTKGEYYGRAAENLSLVRELASRTTGRADAPR